MLHCRQLWHRSRWVFDHLVGHFAMITDLEEEGKESALSAAQSAAAAQVKVCAVRVKGGFLSLRKLCQQSQISRKVMRYALSAAQSAAVAQVKVGVECCVHY